MSENNESYRIRTNVGSEYNGDINLNVNLLQDYDEFEILSLKIDTENLYKYHTSHYGCIVGRVLANGGVGVPNVKISSFIPVEDIDTADPVFYFLYPYSSTNDKNRDEIRYNLLTDTKVDDCHQVIGTFPNKRLVLDDNNVIEIYDKYYKFTTTTNGSGDYMLFGLPVGNNIIHSDLDLSDIGILSQKPRDLFYKGYTAKQFENASQFKKDTNLNNLTQVISQDSSVYVFPFWGDETENEGQIKIVRHDIDVNYKFEPTCIFIGSIVSDEKSNAISKNCIPHERMGKMDRLTAGAGTIEMIRKNISGGIESIAIQGNELIDGNGTWCYQIPMNLDYVATDEYGNLVPTDDYNRGLPTRTSVRFRISLADYESDYENAHLVKVLVPNNPDVKSNEENVKYIDYDYEFGSATKDDSFRNMFWNNVYTVKSYIPRFQKGNRQRNKNFSGFKAVNVNGTNNPIPYNNMRINLTFLFVFQCLIFKSLVLIVKTLNKILYVLNEMNCAGGCGVCEFTCTGDEGPVYLTLDGGMCPALEGSFIAPGAVNSNKHNIITHTYQNVYGDEFMINANIGGGTINGDEISVNKGTALPYDDKSSDGKNSDLKPNDDGVITGEYTPDDVPTSQTEEKTEQMKIYNQESYFVKCVELQFAMEYEVIQFDFYNDWINGLIYIPRWFAEIKKNKDKAYYCGDTFKQNRMLTQQCALAYNENSVIDEKFNVGCRGDRQQCHKRWGRKQVKIFGAKRGIVTAQKNSRGQYAYYLKPSELINRGIDLEPVKANLFQTDIVLLGSVLDCNQYGIPKVNGYTSSSYKMPPPTAEIVSDTQEMMLEETELTQEKIEEFAAENTVNPVNSKIISKINTILLRNFKIQECDCNETKINSNVITYDGPVHSINSTSCLAKDTQKIQFLKDIVSERYPNEEINDIKDLYITGKDVLSFVYKILSNSITTTDVSNYADSDAYIKHIYDKLRVGVNDLGNIETDYTVLNNNIKDKRNSIITEFENASNKSNPFPIISYLMKGSFEDLLSDSNIEKICKDAQEDYIEEINSLAETNDTSRFHIFEKKHVYNAQLDGDDLENGEEATYSELSGVDWGYNPFKVGEDDNTSLLKNQVAGHFLEIGCTFSLSNIKSCVNLQRVCEIGGEISQSHYFYNRDTKKWNLLDPTGIIAKREIADSGIRSTFATLNSKKLDIIPDSNNGYKKYDFIPYNPVSFMGDLVNKDDIADLRKISENEYENYGLIETQSLSYKSFRFGTTGDTSNKYLIKDDEGNYYMSQYENSFYFYFGLKDGNTAIDRLYTEYYAPCTTNSDIPGVSFTIVGKIGYGFDLHYNTENMGRIKSVTVKYNGTKLENDSDFIWDKKNCVITVKEVGKYVIRLKDTSNQIIKAVVACTEDDYETDINDVTDDFNVELKLICYEQDETGTRSTDVFYNISPYFNVVNIYLNGETVEFDKTEGKFSTNYAEPIKITFKNEIGKYITKDIDTNIKVKITRKKEISNYYSVSYITNPKDFKVTKIYSDPVYDKNGISMAGCYEEGGAKSAVFFVGKKIPTFLIYNGYNENGNSYVTIHYKNEDESIEVLQTFQTEPSFDPHTVIPCNEI